MIIRLLTIFILLYTSFFCQEGKIIIVGDTQRSSRWEIGRENTAGITKKLMNQIATEECDYIMHLGDVTFRGSSDEQWRNFETDASNILKKKLLIYPVPGNHEYFGNNDEALENYFNHFSHLNKKLWYSVKKENLGIIFLNSNFDDLSDTEYSEQLKWYKNVLSIFQKDTTIKFIIAACHHSPYTNSRIVKPSEDVQENFVKPFLETPKAKLFLSGHCHSYEHFMNGDKHFIVSGGGGGPRQELTINPTKRKYKDLFDGPSIRFFHYCRLTYSRDEIKLEVIRMYRKTNGFVIADNIIIK